MSIDSMFEGWLTEGGLDDQPVTLRNAIFTTNIENLDDNGDPVVFLSIDLVPEDPDVTTFEGQRFGVGKGWEITDEGASLVRVDGKKAQYNKGSKAGRLCSSLLDLPSFRDAVKARHAAGDQITPFTTGFFEGLKGTIKANEGHFKSSDGEDVTFRYYTITEFHGYEGSSGGAGSGSAKPAKKAAAKKVEKIEVEAEVEIEVEAPKPAKKAAAKKAAAKKDEGGVEALRAKLVDHCNATSAESHEDWMVEVYETFADELVTDEQMALVDDPAEIWDTIWS